MPHPLSLKFDEKNFNESFKRLLPYFLSKNALARQLVVDENGDTFIRAEVENDHTFLKVKSAQKLNHSNESLIYIHNFTLASLLEEIYKIRLNHNHHTSEEIIDILREQRLKEQNLEQHSEQNLAAICAISAKEIIFPVVIIQRKHNNLTPGVSYNAKHLFKYFKHTKETILETRINFNHALFELINLINPTHRENMQEEIEAVEIICEKLMLSYSYPTPLQKARNSLKILEEKVSECKKLHLLAFFNHDQELTQLDKFLPPKIPKEKDRGILTILLEEERSKQSQNNKAIRGLQKTLLGIGYCYSTIAFGIALSHERWNSLGKINWMFPIILAVTAFYHAFTTQKLLSPTEQVIEQAKWFKITTEMFQEELIKQQSLVKKISEETPIQQRFNFRTSQQKSNFRTSLMFQNIIKTISDKKHTDAAKCTDAKHQSMLSPRK